MLASADKPDGKRKVKRLFVYDDELAFARLAAPLLYPGSNPVKFKSWKELSAVLSSYGEVEELIFWVHGTTGTLLIHDSDGSLPLQTPQATRDLLAKTKLRVTRAVVFEGCNIMRAPRDAAIIVSGIAGPGVSITGYSYYMVVQPITVSGFDEASAAELLKKWDGFWIGSPSAASFVGSGKHTRYRRYFADNVDLDAPAPFPDPLPSLLKRSEFSKRSQLEPKSISSVAEAEAFAKELDAPVNPIGYVVTVNDALTLAK